MRIIRYETQASKKPKYGWILNDKVGEIGGNVFGRYQRKEAETPLADVKLLAPSMPSKIICVGRNYVEHAKELVPSIVTSSNSVIIGDISCYYDNIRLVSGSLPGDLRCNLVVSSVSSHHDIDCFI